MFGSVPPGLPEQLDLLLLDDFSMIAFTSLVEPLRAANMLSENEVYRWRTLSTDGKPVAASNGVRIEVDAGFASTMPGATVVVCAGVGGERFTDPFVLGKLKELSRSGIAIGGVCTGAAALARAGLLDGHRCTIHWENVEGFAEEFPDLDVTATLFEVDRRRFTCSGGTAPLDMMIYGIALDHGEDLAVGVAEYLLHNSIRHAHDTQRMPIQYRTGISHPKLLAVIAHMEAYVENPASVEDLAAFVSLSPRQMERLFKEKVGKTPSRYYTELRLQRARLLLRQTSMPVLAVGVATGFVSGSHFARCYRQMFSKSPTEERADLERILE